MYAATLRFSFRTYVYLKRGTTCLVRTDLYVLVARGAKKRLMVDIHTKRYKLGPKFSCNTSGFFVATLRWVLSALPFVSCSSQDDPKQRRPDISFAKRALDWEPNVALEEGLQKTIDYFRYERAPNSASNTNVSFLFLLVLLDAPSEHGSPKRM